MPATVTCREAGPFAIQTLRYAPEEVLGPHVHEAPYFCHVVRGAYSGTYGVARQTAVAGGVAFRAAGERHSVRFSSAGAKVLILEVRGPLSDRLPSTATDFTSGSLQWLASKLCREIEGDAPCGDLVMESVGLEMVATLLRGHPDDAAPRWLRKVEEFLRAHATDRISLGTVARLAQRHPAHVAATFRRAYGMSVGDFIRRLRIERACQQLIEGDAPCSDIALECGFVDQSHFTRFFKRFTGTTPAGFRHDQRSNGLRTYKRAGGGIE